MIQTIRKKFNALFGKEEILVRSPGRVNLIGEHVDYNGGFVLPAAINMNIHLAASRRNDSEIHLHALDFDETFSTDLEPLVKSDKLWPNFLLGVADQLLKKGFKLGGFNILFTGDIPQGAGLSSSAALECATAFALDSLFNLGVAKLELAQIAQAAENDFVGLNCGLMDQFASVFGKAESLIKLDCRNLNYEYIHFPASEMAMLLLDTGVKHSLASSAYNERREQCEQGVALISREMPEVTSLRQVSEEMLRKYVKPANELVYKRCSYVVSEILRVQEAVSCLLKNDLSAFGQKMYETHAGLRYLYEVSCAELDCLVELASKESAVIGARMMGGGFGGCTINLVPKEDVNALVDRIGKGYKLATGLELKAYVAQIGAGTSLIE